MTTSRNLQSPKNPGPSFLGLRSPLSSLFSFRKSAKQTLKPPSPHERHGIFSISGQIPPDAKVDRKFDIYHSTRNVKQIASFFEEQHNRARENDTTKATNQLEREVFQVLGDLDQKLAQEESHNRTPSISRLANYTYGRQYSKEGLLHNTAEPKNVYGCLPSHDGRRSGPPEGTHTTYATYQPRKFYEMYSNRQRRVSKPEASNKSFYNKSPSLFSAVSNITPRSSPVSGSFSTSSLQLSSPGLHLERIRQNKSRRTPIASIKWNNSFPSGHPEGIGRPFRTQSTLDLTNLEKPNQYKNVPGLPVSTSNDLHESRNIKNLTNTTCMNIVDNRSTGYDITDSPGHCPEVIFSTQPERLWEEDYKKNDFNKNEMSKAPIDNSGSSDMETEPMELESDLSVQLDASSMANEEPSIHEGDIPVDCTLHNPEPLEVSSIHISEPENMDIDAPNVFLNSRNSSTSTVGLGPSAQEDNVPPKTEAPGLALADHNKSLDTIKKFSSFKPGTVYKVDTSSFTNPKSSEISNHVNKSDHKSSSLSGNTTDVGGRFAWMNMRRGLNNHTEGFRSDALKFQKRNASSLPDLLDQDSENVANNSDVQLHKGTCENVLECGATTVPATQSSRISSDSNELHLESNSKYVQPCVQDPIPQKQKNLSTRNDQYLQKPNMFSYSSIVDGAFKNLDRTATFPAVPYEAKSLTKKSNHTGFLSDTLKYKKRNASSLSDLLDQDSEIMANNSDVPLHKGTCENVLECGATTVPATQSSSRISSDSNELHLENNSKYMQPCVQDPIPQKLKNLSTRNDQYLQKPNMFSYRSIVDGAFKNLDRTATFPAVPYEAESLTEKYDHRGFLSDTLKYKKRNASSLSDLLDQDSEIMANNSDIQLHKGTCENVLECGATTVPATQSSSRISSDSNELHLENNSKYMQPCVQDPIPQKLKNLSTRNDQYLQKPNMFSYRSIVDGAFKNLDRTATFPAVPYEAESLTKKYNHTGFLSDTLTYKKRNASSLSDLLDQDSEIMANNSDIQLHKGTCENVLECGATTVPATQSSSRISSDSNELHLENNSKYMQPCVQDPIPQKLKNLSTRNDQYLQKPNMFSYRSIVDGAFKNLDRTATFPAVPYEAESLTEKYDHRGFLSDTLKYKKRNASSLSDLLDQDSEIMANNSDIQLHKGTCENVLECGATTVPATQFSSRISSDSNELHLENNSKYMQPCVQDPIPQKLKNLSARDDQYLQKPNMFSYRSIVDGAFKNLDRTATFPAVPYEAESLTERYDHRGFLSDTLKYKKRNASSLSDLLDQDSKIMANNSDIQLHKGTCENVLECGATTVPATQSSSRISSDSNELHLENNSKYMQPCVQDPIPQKLKNLSTRNDQYLQKPNMFSYRSIVDGAFKNLDRTATFPAVPYEAESLTKKYNHTGFLSDTLTYKKRNASSLSDLLDQESDIFGNDPENILRKNGCRHDGDYHTSTVLKTRSSRIPDERKERYLESSTRYEQSVQDTNRQPKISTSSTWQSIQRVSPFFRGSDLDCSSIQTEKRTTESEVAYRADKMTENNKVKNLLHLTETPQFSHVHAKYKLVNFNRSQYNGSDSNNNNTQLIGGIQTSNILNKDKSIIERGYIHQKQDHPEKEQVKSSKCDTSSKPNLSSVYQKDVASSPNQKNTDQSRQVEQGCESEGNLNQNLIYQLDREANNKAEYTDPPKIRDSSRFPVSHSAKECSEEDNFSRATHLHNIESQSTNLLKQHLFVAPEPFKGNVRVSVIPKSEWKNSTSSEDSQSPTHQEGENIKNFYSEYKASKEDLQPHKTYTCQQIMENTEIYESLTDISYPEVDKIEYRKVVSVYYSFPHKFARRISDLSKNNLKNIDKTLQQSRAPSALLDIIGRCHKEEPDFNLLSSEDVKTSITEAVHSVEDVPSKTHHSNFHIIPLQTDLLKNGSRTNSGEENDDLVNKFSSLHISENEDNHKAREDPKNKNKYSPSGSSPRYSPNSFYFTLPNRKSSLQDLERNVLKRDIAMALDRINIYPGSRNMEPSPPEFQDVFASPTACYDNFNYSPRYDFMHFQESSKQECNINNIFARNGGLYKKNSMDEGIILREDLPSIYKSKSYKDLSQHKSYNTEDLSPHTDCNTSPQTDYNHPAFSSVINQARPSYCSEFVQKKMKPINAKKFSFSVDRSSQESVSPRHTGSYDDTVQLFDGNSPSVFHSPDNNYPSHADKYFGQEKPKDGGNSNLYRSKSMKVLNTEGQQSFVDYKRKSDGSFSSKSYGGTLKSKSPPGKTWNRTSSVEILDENDNWPVSDERKALCTTKSFDYGIFGKEQQEAIVNNVKRSLTEGRLWRPSFLKNPGFLRTEELCSSQEINPVAQTPEESSSQWPNVKESLNIYEDVHVVPSDSDTETTTEDEYYLDEYYFNDKESEL
ncbi:exophilin-5 isoform X2 [Bufo gargarizans]|nr:exophilin-5 isoform X2 [Bufo gargarizans]